MGEVLEDPFKLQEIQHTEMLISKAKELSCFLISGENPFARLLKCYRLPDNVEAVDFEVDVEVSQITKFDIRNKEVIRVLFFPQDDLAPDVLAMREDFPRVPHTNLRPVEFPISLCLYDQEYSEIKLTWSAASLIERIRSWLARTADGKLHMSDQPLEPLLGNCSVCAIPESILGSSEHQELALFPHKIDDTRTFYAARPPFRADEELCKFLHLLVKGSPQLHGVIKKSPANLEELATLLGACDIDLVECLRERIGTWIDDIEDPGSSDVLQRKLVIQVALPKLREENGEVEETDYFAFATIESTLEVACKLGNWALHGSVLATVMDAEYELQLQDIGVAPFALLPLLTHRTAALQSGETHSDPAIMLVGAGALGSQLFLNCLKSGFGKWVIVDKDQLFPHNLARHALDIRFLGLPKASSLATDAGNFIWEGIEVGAIDCDIFNPKENANCLKEVLGAANVIVDCSASTAVLRSISEWEVSGRRVSIFLNRRGNHLVFLAEDIERNCSLDSLEMQYLREVINNSRLLDHFEAPVSRIRYGNGCSDVNFQISTEQVSIFSAIASKALKRQIERQDAVISLWTISSEDFSVSSISVPVAATKRKAVNGWTVVYDQQFLSSVTTLRSERLPNETGGVLIGTFDLQRRTIFLVEALSAPSDSLEYPTCFIRGSSGLLKDVEEIFARSGGSLCYVGEWHSHPDGASVNPSADDSQVLNWIFESLQTEGLPGLIMIVGADSQLGIYIKDSD